MTNKLGNGLTLGKFILIMIAARTLSMTTAYGINLPISDIELAGYLGLIAGFIYSILDSYFKNNIKWDHFKNFLSKILDQEIPEDNEDNEIKIEKTDADPTTETENEPEELEEDVVGDDVNEDAEC